MSRFMEKKILAVLLDSYERSRLFREGDSARRIQFRPMEREEFAELAEQSDARREFLDTAEELAAEGLIEYDWVRYEEGNLIDRIFLRTEEAAVRQSYLRIGRVRKQAQLDVLESQVQAALFRIEAAFQKIERKGDEKITAWLSAALEEIRCKRRIPRLFFKGEKDPESEKTAEKKNERLLQFLELLAGNEDELLERVVSTRLYGDSKYFERELRSKVLSVLRRIEEDGYAEELNGEELLGRYGIVRWPEILEFTGPVVAMLDGGDGSLRKIDYRDEVYGAYINSDTVRHLTGVRLNGVSRILTIENKANYISYINGMMAADELVIYHGGCYSPIKGRWLRLIAEEAEKGKIQVFHWSDIDLGGFRIFVRLRDEIFSSLRPYKMDLETLEKYGDRCMPIDDQNYLDTLAGLEAKPEYEVFYEVIRKMSSVKIRLEQEAEIV